MQKKEWVKTPTKEQIEKWKKAYGEVHKITIYNEDKDGRSIIEDGKEKYVGYFKRVGRQTLSFATRMSEGGEDFTKFAEALVEHCLIAGDREIETVDAFMFEAGKLLNKTVPEAKSDMEKL